MECVKFDTRNWRKIKLFYRHRSGMEFVFIVKFEVFRLLSLKSKPPRFVSQRWTTHRKLVSSEAVALNFFSIVGPLEWRCFCPRSFVTCSVYFCLSATKEWFNLKPVWSLSSRTKSMFFFPHPVHYRATSHLHLVSHSRGPNPLVGNTWSEGMSSKIQWNCIFSIFSNQAFVAD